MAQSYIVPGLTRGIGQRAVHLRISPRTASLAQSREVLGLLRSYGRIEMYKSLKYDALAAPNTILAIFESEESASKLLRDSPLRFTMYEDHDEGGTMSNSSLSMPYPETGQTTTAYPDDRSALADSAVRLSQQAATHAHNFSSSSPHNSSPRANDVRRTMPEPRDFQIQVNVARIRHRDAINADSYNGPFAVNTKSAMQEDLAKRVPLIGLSDVNLKRMAKPWRVLARESRYEKDARKPLRQLWHETKNCSAGP